MQPQHSSSGGSSGPSRRHDNSSPAPSDDSDSDISLGTHSPVPSSLSLQHSPGSTSGGGNDDRLQEDRDKDYRSFSLSSFRFDTHSPGIPGKFLVILFETNVQIWIFASPKSSEIGKISNLGNI